MRSNAISSDSDSQNPPRRHNTRQFTLTPLGFQACKWIEEQEQLPDDDDQFAFFCEDCLRPLSMCSCAPFEIEMP